MNAPAHDPVQLAIECLRSRLDDTVWKEDLDVLRAEVAALREDKARLDWLDELMASRVGHQVNSQPRVGMMETNEVTVYVQGRGLSSRAETVRAAIDAARAPESQTPAGSCDREKS